MGIGYIFAQKFDFCSAGTDVVKKYMDIISIHGISVFSVLEIIQKVYSAFEN